MVVVQAKPRRKASGSRYKGAVHKKTLAQYGSHATLTGLGTTKRDTKRSRGGQAKLSLVTANTVNVFDPTTKKYTVATIKTITDNPANKNFVRRNIMTRGTIIDTSAGKAKITSRPGQEGGINAVLVATK
jgi:small subunit ribosomal protein S8e